MTPRHTPPHPLEALFGFTLMELMVALSIVALLSSGGFIWVRDAFQKWHAFSVQKQVEDAVNQAKHLALAYQDTVTLCPSLDKKNCSTNWAHGQIIFLDRNANAQVDPEDEILYVFDGLRGNERLIWNGFHADHFIQMIPAAIGNMLNGSFHYCVEGSGAKYNWRLVLNRMGRMRVENHTNCEIPVYQ